MPKKLFLEDKECLYCGKTFNRNKLPCGQLENSRDYGERKFCSHGCFSKNNCGENHWYWNGGLKHRKDGYIRYSNDTYVHRVVMEKILGRKLRRSEIVHHIDGNTSNNSESNLTVYSNSYHRQLHCKEQKRNKIGRFSKE